jgi:hypothetical protein
MLSKIATMQVEPQMIASKLPGDRMEDAGKSLNPKCPRCGSVDSFLDLQRIRRRFVDRLIGTLRPSYRYRCRATGCDWEGNLSVRPSS